MTTVKPTKRSKLFERYLRERLGWETGVESENRVCGRCGKLSDRHNAKYCWNCGSKLPKKSTSDSAVYAELEQALRSVIDGED